jgi:hypothetical protein
MPEQRSGQQLNMAKTNFTYLLMAHLIALVLAVVLFFTMAAESRHILETLMIIILISVIVQVVLYRAKPGWFADKTRPRP